MGKVPIAVVLVVCVLTAKAGADRRVEAQQLFDDGKKLMAIGRHAEACPKFAASHEIAPSPSTLMNLAACHEAGKRLATAWVTFKEAAALALRADPALAEPSRRRADALELRLSSLRVVVPGGSRIAGLEILRNGVVLVEAQWNTNQYVDGGEYEIVARAPNAKPWTARVTVTTEHDDRAVEIPALAETRAAPPKLNLTASESSVYSPPVRFTPRRKLAVVVGGLGLVTLGAGTFLGLRASAYQADSDAICPTTSCDDAEGLRLNGKARSTGTKAFLLLVGGGVLVGGSAVLWLSGRPQAVDVVPVVGPDTVGVSLSGSL